MLKERDLTHRQIKILEVDEYRQSDLKIEYDEDTVITSNHQLQKTHTNTWQP